MNVIKGVLVHTDSPELTYHKSVSCADIVPLYRDFNELDSIGRARVYWDQEAGTITVDLHLDNDVVDITDPPVVVLGNNGGTNIFLSEDGTTYAMTGYIASATLMTNEGMRRAMASEIKQVESVMQEPDPEVV